jgi:hypothetical protein
MSSALDLQDGFRTVRNPRAERRSSLFIVGAPRSGTTSLAKALATHPQICFSKPKETHFFLRPGPASPEEMRRRFEAAYFRTAGLAHRVLAEGSVSYLYDPQAIRRILDFDRDALLVACLRNPLEMLPSYHARLVYMLDEDVADFRKAWALQERRRRGEAIPRRCRDPRLLMYAGVGRLGRHERRLIEIAGRERCFFVRFDHFTADPLRVYRALLDFAGLPEDGRTESPPQRSAHLPTCLAAAVRDEPAGSDREVGRSVLDRRSCAMAHLSAPAPSQAEEDQHGAVETAAAVAGHAPRAVACVPRRCRRARQAVAKGSIRLARAAVLAGATSQCGERAFEISTSAQRQLLPGL